MTMARTYRGVIRDGVVVVADGDRLPDGAVVEIRIINANDADEEPPRARVPDAVKTEMLARGLVLEFKEPLLTAPEGDRPRYLPHLLRAVPAEAASDMVSRRAAGAGLQVCATMRT